MLACLRECRRIVVLPAGCEETLLCSQVRKVSQIDLPKGGVAPSAHKVFPGGGRLSKTRGVGGGPRFDEGAVRFLGKRPYGQRGPVPLLQSGLGGVSRFCWLLLYSVGGVCVLLSRRGVVS